MGETEWRRMALVDILLFIVTWSTLQVICAECRAQNHTGSGGIHHVLEVDSAELSTAADRERDLLTLILLTDADRRLNLMRSDDRRIADYRRDIEAEHEQAIRRVDEQVGPISTFIVVFIRALYDIINGMI